MEGVEEGRLRDRGNGEERFLEEGFLLFFVLAIEGVGRAAPCLRVIELKNTGS